MTPFRNDETNPFSRPSVWPKMPQTPMRVGALPRPAPPPEPPAPDPVRMEVIAAAAEAEMAIPEPAPLPPRPEAQPEPPPIAAPVGQQPARASRREPRLTPLVAAAAVGAGGMAALFLLLDVRPALAPRAPPPEPRAALAVGEMVGQSQAPAVTEAAPAPQPPPAPAARPTPRLAVARTVAPRAAPPIQVQPATTEPAPAPLLVPPPRPIASLAGPAETPLTPGPAAAPFTPPPPPDRNAPIATHVPDGS
jgi:hypothetical protein